MGAITDRGSIYTTIMESGPQNHNGDGLLGPNSIVVVYMDPLGNRQSSSVEPYSDLRSSMTLTRTTKLLKPDQQGTCKRLCDCPNFTACYSHMTQRTLRSRTIPLSWRQAVARPGLVCKKRRECNWATDERLTHSGVWVLSFNRQTPSISLHQTSKLCFLIQGEC